MTQCFRYTPLRCVVLLLCMMLVCAVRLSPTAAQSETVLGASDPNAALALAIAVSSYQMLSPAITIDIVTPVSETDALSQLLNGTLDFISTTMVLSPNLTSPASPLYDAAASDLLWCPYLIAPLVPIYRLDSITGSTALVLSTAALCSIYTGSLTWWNDTRLAGLNPTLTLSATPITVVVAAEPSSITLAFTQAMTTSCDSFSSSIGVTDNPVWPSGSYAGYIASISPASTALLVNGAIGFTSLPIALTTSVDVASMLTRNNQPVVASALSATFAATELLSQSTSISLTSKQPTSATSLLPATLVGPTGQQAWPMTLVSSFVLHTNTTSSTGNCGTRAILVSFVKFMYTSSVAATLLANLEYAAYPSVALNELSLPALLQTSVLCDDGSLAYSLASSASLQSTAAAATTHTMYGDSRFSAILSLVAGLFSKSEQSEGHAVNVNYAGASNTWQGVEAVLRGQGEAALVTLDLLNLTQQASLQGARDSGQFYVLPLFVYAIVPVYNPVLTASISLPSTLTMDPVTLITVAGLYVNDWRSPLLAPFVAPLALTNLTTPLPIQFISPCNSSIPTAPLREFYSVFVPYAPTLSAYLYNSSSTLYSPCNSSFYDASSFVAGQPHGVFPAPTEAAVPSLVDAVSGAMSFQRATGNVEQAVIQVDFGVGVGGITANVTSMLACLDVFDPITLTAPLNASTNSSCYFFSRAVYAIVPTSIVDTAGDGCASRPHMLEFLRQLTETDTYDALLDDQLLVRAGQVQAVQVAVLNAINSITCVDPSTGYWDTLLIQTPIAWSLSKAITMVGLALGSIGIVCAVASFALTAVFHRHSVIRAASPVFLCLTLLGLAVMYVSSLMLSLPPSTSSCAGLSWCFHLGFQLAFAPLLAKTYRVYRIYGGQKLNVVKLSNSRLALIVVALIAMEVALLAAFQIVSPMRPLIVSRTSGSPLRLHDYAQCSVDSSGMPLFLALCIEKGVVLLLGALMAFSTRRVSATYSESSGIAWSIYNLLLSMAVLVPLVLLIDAVGDTLVALLLFALLWVSSFTLCVLFMPRLAAMLSQAAETLDEHESGARVVGADGFSFLSLASFEASSGAMGQYVAALELHLAQANARHTQLKQGDFKGKEWMRATAARKQSVASVGNDSHVARGRQQQPEQRRAREKSLATVTAPPKASLSYMTQTQYSSDAARSNAATPSLAAAQKARVAVAASSRAALSTAGGGNSASLPTLMVTATPTVSLRGEPQESPSSSGAGQLEKNEQQLHEQQQPQVLASAIDSVGGASPVQSAAIARPASVSRSRSSRVQPSFEKAVLLQADKRVSVSRSIPPVAQTQPDDSSMPHNSVPVTLQPQDTREAETAAVDLTHRELPTLPVVDDMVVHDLSSRMARASIHDGLESAVSDNSLAVSSTTAMRTRGSSRGILMTPVTGSTRLSSVDGSRVERVRVTERNGELDIETADAMQDLE